MDKSTESTSLTKSPSQQSVNLVTNPEASRKSVLTKEGNDGKVYDASSQSASISGGTSATYQQFQQLSVNQRDLLTVAPSAAATNTSNWSTSLQTLLDKPSATLPQKILLGGVAFLVTFGTWATIGQIDEVGIAQGKLVPKGQVYKVHALELDKIAKIHIEEGQWVKAGQKLVELDTELVAAEVGRLEQLLSAEQTELSQKAALADKIRLEAQSRDQIAKADTQAQKAAIAQAKSKAAVIKQRLVQDQAWLSVEQERLERMKPLAFKAKELLTQRRADVNAQQERLKRLQPLLVDGAISRELVFQAEQNLRASQSAITQSQLQEETNTTERIFQAEQSLRDRTLMITQNQGELQQTLAEIERLQAVLSQKQTEESRIAIELQQQIGQLQLEMTQLKAKIANNQNLLTSAKAKLKKKFLYAPIDGVVSSFNFANIGEVVQPSQAIAEIAPDSVPLVLSASLPNREAGFIRVGMKAQVKFDAYPYQEYGVVSGEVTSVSPDAKADPQMGAVYRVEVELERNYVTDDEETIKFKAGQTANADIIIRRRRIADFLLEPFKKLQKGGINI
ncbi:MAG: HlyD family efflux transporter periplasmic adaptor subunit [Symploca sp. SIO3C6]|nr:HlyD family efflux transporter periplasmic adaptor subunit [Symploca sp. SIO3C6]